MAMRNMPIQVAAIVTLLLLHAALGAADTVDVQLPYGQADNEAIAILASSAVHVSRIIVAAHGTSRAQWSAIGYDPDAVTECTNLVVEYPDLIVRVGPAGSLLSHLTGYGFRDDGAFAIADTFAVDITLPDGKLGMTAQYWYNMRAFDYQCVLSHWNCRTCVDALLEFDAYPMLTVDFEPVVGTEIDSWGALKAKYR